MGSVEGQHGSVINFSRDGECARLSRKGGDGSDKRLVVSIIAQAVGSSRGTSLNGPARNAVSASVPRY
jgi:hypothetical protein